MEEFISESSVSELFPEVTQETMPEYLLAMAEFHGNNGRSVYLEDGISGEKRYFKDFEEQTRRFASHFYKKGLRKGDIVLYMASYQTDQVLLMTGVWRANGIFRTLYMDESRETISSKLEESSCRWIFCDATVAASCLEIRSSAPWSVEVVVCGTQTEMDGASSILEFYKDEGDQCPEFELKGDDLAIILPTSGTTGPSKGAMHSHRTLVNYTRTWARFPYTVTQPNIIASKGTHVSGAILSCSMIAAGVHGIVLPKVNKDILIQTVDKYQPGLCFAFPSFLLALGTVDAEGYEVSSIKTILTGGSPVTAEMAKAYRAIPGVEQFIVAFGMTEAPTISTNSDFSNDESAVYTDSPDLSVGKPYPGGKVQIRDIETSQVLGPNQQGEINYKGDLFMGYFRNPEATQNTVSDGWLKTGDVGYLDENGFLFVVDRAKDIFKYYHNHISPTELEGVIGEHPDVKIACVVPIPDEGGEVPRAFVVLKNPEGKDLRNMSDEIETFANERLAAYKMLRGGLYIVEEFPIGKSGKVVRSAVASMTLPEY